jgi:hypothetical protein
MYTEPNLFLGLLHVVLTKYGPKKKKKNEKKQSSWVYSSVDTEKLSVSLALPSVVF